MYIYIYICIYMYIHIITHVKERGAELLGWPLVVRDDRGFQGPRAGGFIMYTT